MILFYGKLSGVVSSNIRGQKRQKQRKQTIKKYEHKLESSLFQKKVWSKYLDGVIDL